MRTQVNYYLHFWVDKKEGKKETINRRYPSHDFLLSVGDYNQIEHLLLSLTTLGIYIDQCSFIIHDGCEKYQICKNKIFFMFSILYHSLVSSLSYTFIFFTPSSFCLPLIFPFSRNEKKIACFIGGICDIFYLMKSVGSNFSSQQNTKSYFQILHKPPYVLHEMKSQKFM